MKLKMNLALLCAVFTSGTLAAQLPAEVTEKFNQAAVLIQEKNTDGAIPLLESVIAEGETADPESDVVAQAKMLLSQLLFRSGGAFAQAGKFEDALTAMNKARRLAAQYGVVNVQSQVEVLLPRIYKAYGGTFFNNKDYAKAIEVFSQACEALPKDTDMAIFLGKSYAESGDLTKAEEAYKGVIELGKAHDKYAEAAAEAKADLAGYLLVGAAAKAAAKDLAGVTEATDRVLAFDPGNGTANMIRLQAATNVKNWDAVIGFGEEAASAQPTEEAKSDAYFLLGAAYQNKENKASAIEMYRKVTAGPNAATARAQIAALNQ